MLFIAPARLLLQGKRDKCADSNAIGDERFGRLLSTSVLIGLIVEPSPKAMQHDP